MRNIYLVKRCCKNSPNEFDLWGLRRARVSPNKGKPMEPGGRFRRGCLPWKKRNITKKQKPIETKEIDIGIDDTKSETETGLVSIMNCLR